MKILGTKGVRPHAPTVAAFAFFAVAACGGNASDPKAPVESQSAPGEVAGETTELGGGIPLRCIMRKGACMPPIKWAERLCGDVYQDLALYMFQDGTPWTRYYMRMGLNAVNGWGPTVAEDLVKHEEVLVINHRLRKDALEVEGSEGTYDVLRWNGSCVTLDMAEVTSRTPGTPRQARVDWRTLSERMQNALLEDSEVQDTYERRRKACKGISIGMVTKECEVLDGQLVDVIARHVRSARTLPEPERYP